MYGAVILDEQREIPEQVTFTWYFRDDGQSVLDPNDPHVSTGTGQSVKRNMPEIRFEQFVVLWSVAATGSGYVYYDRLPSEPAQPNALEIAMTALTEVDAVDANDPAWVYRSAPPARHIQGQWYFD